VTNTPDDTDLVAVKLLAQLCDDTMQLCQTVFIAGSLLFQAVFTLPLLTQSLRLHTTSNTILNHNSLQRVTVKEGARMIAIKTSSVRDT